MRGKRLHGRGTGAGASGVNFWSGAFFHKAEQAAENIKSPLEVFPLIMALV